MESVAVMGPFVYRNGNSDVVLNYTRESATDASANISGSSEYQGLGMDPGIRAGGFTAETEK